jgi:hypothetical protein
MKTYEIDHFASNEIYVNSPFVPLDSKLVDALALRLGYIISAMT